MFRNSWHLSRKSAAREPRRPGPRATPAVERLEDRALLSYSFMPIAETGGYSTYSALSNPSMNSEGRISLRAIPRASPSGMVLFSTDGVRDRIIAVTNDEWRSFISNGPINAEGTVSYFAELRGGGQASLKGDGGEAVLITDTTGKNPFSSFVSTSGNMDNAGNVVVAGNLRAGGQAILLGDGGPLTTLSTSQGGIWTTVLGNAFLNESGQVSFRAALDQGGQGIFLTEEVNGKRADRLLIQTNDLYRDFTASSPINDAGVIITVANLWKGGQHFLMHDGEKLQVLAGTTGAFSTFATRCVNNSEDVFFLADLAGGGSGLFAGFDVEKDAIIVVGDRLLGSTVTQLFFAGGSACNDDGQVAFRATLEDGRTVAVRADPERGALQGPPLGAWAVGVLNADGAHEAAAGATGPVLVHSPAVAAWTGIEPDAARLALGVDGDGAESGLDLLPELHADGAAFFQALVTELTTAPGA